MKLELSAVKSLAPDDASIKAAEKLTKPASWIVLAKKEAINTIWGECKGSGKKPYYTVVNVEDNKYKCTCPSRKLPCKHTLALMWQFATDADKFAETETPEWVNEWVDRANKSKARQETKAKNAAKVLTPEEQEKKEKAARKRAETARKKTVAGVTVAMEDLQKWIDTQLDNGLDLFIKNVQDECENIAARMVDAKAAAIAIRIREIPEKIENAEESLKVQVVFQELAKIAMLAKYWKMDPDDADLFQSVVTTQKKDSFIDSDESKTVEGRWLKVAQRVDTKIRGLTSNESWYLRVDQAEPEFAMTLDYYRKKDLNQDEWPKIGDIIVGSFQYYPSRYPTRSVINVKQHIEQYGTEHLQREILDVNAENIWQKHAEVLKIIPWQDEVITILEDGYITTDEDKSHWWVGNDGKTTVKLSNEKISLFFLGSTWQRAVMITNGTTSEICSVYNETWGFYGV